MTARIEIAGLRIAKVLYDFVATEALAGAPISASEFWKGCAALIREFSPRNRDLLALRELLQARIDDFHRTHTGRPIDPREHERFLRKIGYLLPEPADV